MKNKIKAKLKKSKKLKAIAKKFIEEKIKRDMEKKSDESNK